MAYCDHCGFYLDDDDSDCEMCESHHLVVESQAIRAQRWEEEQRQNRQPVSERFIPQWWRIIAATPIFLGTTILLSHLLNTSLILPYLFCLLFYGVAIHRDATHLRATTTWNPDVMVWVWIAGLNIISVGLLTFVITPVYLYLRHVRTESNVFAT